jgi:serine/threonine protein kinase/dipeptidyl aminopeptidase/acylaminoacyl peptidase
MMKKLTTEQLRSIESIFEQAIERTDFERDDFLDAACGGDQVLRNAVDSLLQARKQAQDFLETPVMDEVFITTESQQMPACIAHYKVMQEIGRGGMGEVFLAHDTKLERPVALKILPHQFTKNPEQVKRFEREARAASALNHPNIITIHDIVQEGNTHFIATEFIEGQTLRQKIEPGKLNLQEALDITIQIARALKAAHAAGIIHRDIKPENIMVRDDGLVKVLDFGLAKPFTDDSSPNSVFATPANDLRTNPETFMGTVGYMSPEQVLREPLDHRTDIFSLGVVIYEMLAGERPFKGNDFTEIMSAVLHSNPSLPDIESHSFDVEKIVSSALQKDRHTRYQTADDLLLDLQHLAHELSLETSAIENKALSRQKASWTRKAVWAISGIIFISVILYWAAKLNSTPEALPTPAFIVAAKPFSRTQALEYNPSFSPDGQSIIFESFAYGISDIYMQRIGDRTAINLTENYSPSAAQPAFSPDGERIAFWSQGICTMNIQGGDIKRLSDEGHNPAWSSDGKEIVYATDRTIDSGRSTVPSQLWIITVETGEKRLLTKGDATQPKWSPHGQRIAYWNTHHGGQRDIWTIPASGGDADAIAVTNDEFEDWGPVWSPDGTYLYFLSNRGGSMNLWRIAIEEQTGKVSGQPEPVTTPAVFCWHVCFSNDGKRIAYVQVSKKGNINRLTIDPVKGKAVGEPVSITQGSNFATEPAVSSDGQSLVYSSFGDKQIDLYLLNLSSTTDSRKDTTIVNQNNPLRLTDDPFKDNAPQWSPDGQKIAFYSDRSGTYQLWMMNKDGSNLEQLTFEKDGNIYTPIWSPDGSGIVYPMKDAKALNTFVMKTTQSWAEQTPQLLPKSDPLISNYIPSSWSTDGLKLAGWQQWTEKGKAGVYVYSFASKSYERWTDFGSFPLWLSDNRRLLFFKGDQIYLIDEVSKKPKLIYAINSIAWSDLAGITVTRDNRQIYYSQVTTEADIWVADIR